MAKEKKVKGEQVEKPEKMDAFTSIHAILNQGTTHFGIISDFEDTDNIRNEKVSTGSINFDGVLEGGFPAGGIALVYGDEESGKTAMGLNWARNWQDKFKEQAMVVYFDAEGRLTEYKIKQSGIDTSTNRFLWVRTNRGDDIYKKIDELVAWGRKNKIRFFFVVDSTDALMRTSDLDKGFDEAEKIAGGALLASVSGKRLSLPIHSLGHFLYLISQKRMTNIRMGSSGASGGKASKFYADLTVEIAKPWTETMLPKGAKDKDILGHLCRLTLKKTGNETTGTVVDIPIKRKKKGGIWSEYETFQLLTEYSFVEKSGSWFNFAPHFQEILVEGGFEDVAPIKLQGSNQFVEFLEGNSELNSFIRKSIIAMT